MHTAHVPVRFSICLSVPLSVCLSVLFALCPSVCKNAFIQRDTSRVNQSRLIMHIYILQLDTDRTSTNTEVLSISETRESNNLSGSSACRGHLRGSNDYAIMTGLLLVFVKTICHD